MLLISSIQPAITQRLEITSLPHNRPLAIEYSSASLEVCKVAEELRRMQNYLCYLCDLRIAQLMIDFFE